MIHISSVNTTYTRSGNEPVQALSGIDLGDLELVGIGVLDGSLDLGHDDLIALHSHGLEVFYFNAGKGQEVADFVE